MRALMRAFISLPIVLLTVGVACSRDPFSKTKDISEQIPLPGRCIQLEREMFVIKSDEDELMSSFLSESDWRTAPTGASESIATLRPGSRMIVTRIVLQKSFENVGIAVVGNGVDGTPAVGMTSVFDPFWLSETARKVNNNDRSRIDIVNALDPQRATWCTPMSFGQVGAK